MNKNKILIIIFISFISVFISKNSYSQSVPIKINEEGFLFIPVTLNDSITANFVLDTGGGMIVLSNSVFQKIKSTAKFHGYETGFRHDGERLDGEFYEIPALSIDSYKLNNVIAGNFALLDEIELDGIISLKFFENQPFTIDFKNKILTMESAESLKNIANNAANIPIMLDYFSDYAIDMYIPLVINNSLTLKAEFDTGSGFYPLSINPYYMSMLGFDSTNTKREEYSTPISHIKLNNYTGTLNSVQLNGVSSIELKNKNVTFQANMIHQALIGSEIFKDKALTIDIQSKKMYVR